jgi:hypothetical protein
VIRHSGVAALLRWFEFDHLPVGLPRDVSERINGLVHALTTELNESAELTAAVRDLLKAKDAFVRAAIETVRPAG